MTAPRIISAYEADALLRHGTDAELAAAAPDLAASVVALHADVERLRDIADLSASNAGLYAYRMEQAQKARCLAAATERARIVAWLKEGADKAHARGNEPYGDALLNASRILETSEATP